jgi:hypothetical protein
MTVGGTSSSATVDQAITDIAVGFRELAQKAINLSMQVNGQNNGLAVLQQYGYSSTANPSNPGGVSDAQFAQNMIAYLNTIGGFINGTAGAQPQFNFNNALASTWAGR